MLRHGHTRGCFSVFTIKTFLDPLTPLKSQPRKPPSPSLSLILRKSVLFFGARVKVLGRYWVTPAGVVPEGGTGDADPEEDTGRRVRTKMEPLFPLAIRMPVLR